MACPHNALREFKNGRMAVNYERCQFCTQCVTVCPLKAILCFWTPFFAFSEKQHEIEERNATVGEEGVNFSGAGLPDFIRFRPHVLLNYLDTKLGVSSVSDCYEYLKENIPQSPCIIFDDRCLNNSFKALVEENNQSLNALSADVKLYSEEFPGGYFSPVEFLYDGGTLPLLSESIDIVISNYVLQHVSNAHGYLQEICRILKREGVLFISVPTSKWFIVYLSKKIINYPREEFLAYTIHEEDWNNRKEGTTTFFDKIKRWKTKHWEDLYVHSGFQIKEKKSGTSCFYILIKPL